MTAVMPAAIQDSIHATQETATTTKVVRVGVDLGAHTSVILAHDGTREIPLAQDMVLSVVGYAKEGLLPGVLPEGRRALCGAEALAHKLHMDLVWPLAHKGTGIEVRPAQDFVRALRERVDPRGETELWAVMGCPAHSTSQVSEQIREAVAGCFSRILLLPEPFLAALGMRDESRVNDSSYSDPTRNSIIVDIGAATTDLCLVQGFLPRADEMMSVPRGGNQVDSSICQFVRRRYPDVMLTPMQAMRVKTLHSFVGEPADRLIVTFPVHGRSVRVDVTDQVRAACEELLADIVNMIMELSKHGDPDSIESLLANIILTGGGSLIRGLPEAVEQRLKQAGYETARVRRSEDPKRPVSRGALRVACTVRDDQWQIPL